MSERPTREQAIGLLADHHYQIDELISGVDASRLEEPGTVGEGWSIAQLLGHIEAWERLAVWTIQDWRAEQYPRIHKMYADAGGIDPLNDRLLAERSGWTAEEAANRFTGTYQELTGLIGGMNDAEWARAPFYEPPTPTVDLADAVGKVLGSEEDVFMHAAAHMDDLRDAVGEVSR